MVVGMVVCGVLVTLVVIAVGISIFSSDNIYYRPGIRVSSSVMKKTGQGFDMHGASCPRNIDQVTVNGASKTYWRLSSELVPGEVRFKPEPGDVHIHHSNHQQRAFRHPSGIYMCAVAAGIK